VKEIVPSTVSDADAKFYDENIDVHGRADQGQPHPLQGSEGIGGREEESKGKSGCFAQGGKGGKDFAGWPTNSDCPSWAGWRSRLIRQGSRARSNGRLCPGTEATAWWSSSTRITGYEKKIRRAKFEQERIVDYQKNQKIQKGVLDYTPS
jgi:hypothetical protein